MLESHWGLQKPFKLKSLPVWLKSADAGQSEVYLLLLAFVCLRRRVGYGFHAVGGGGTQFAAAR